MPSEPLMPKVEPDNINIRAIVGFVLGLLILLPVTFWLLLQIYHRFETRAARADALTLSRANTLSAPLHFPQPHEQFSPQLDLQTFRERESNALNTFGWINESSGIVHVPISVAMSDLLASSATNSSDPATGGLSSLQLQQARPNQREPKTDP